jgi:hypothetical protein
MIFTADLYPHELIWCNDPTSQWAAEWMSGAANAGSWHFFGGVA